MKIILPWVVAVLALAGAYFLYRSNQTKTTRIAQLEQELQELETLREENDQLKKSVLPESELTRLRQNTEDLLRLRNEVRQLRDEKAALTQQAQSAQAAVERTQSQLQTALQQAQAAVENALPINRAAALQAQAQALAATNNLENLSPEQRAYLERYGFNPASAQQRASNSCINNLRQLDAAKQQWALENGKRAQDIPGAQEIAVYLKGNTIPACPAGGVYTLNSAGMAPTCSQPGHALPQ